MSDVLDEQSMAFFTMFLKKHSGYNLLPEKSYLLDGRLKDVFQDKGEVYTKESLARVMDMVGRAPQDPMALAIIEAMTVNETSFFRDEHFRQQLERLITDVILPAKSIRRLRIWSAACSTGQEVYSVAMILEGLRKKIPDLEYTITGTDISSEVVKKAQMGSYLSFDVNRGIGDADRERFFTQNGNRWEVSPDIQRHVAFEVHNLLTPYPVAASFDLVLLRNVLFYFDAAVRSVVLRNVAAAMCPKSYLVIGSTENIQKGEGDFVSVPDFHDVYRRGDPADGYETD